MELYRDSKADFIVIDKTGIGQGVYDRIKQLGYPCRGVSFGEKSEDEMFANLKAEWHWRERQWLLSGGRLKSNEGWNEFEYVKYKNKDGKIIIQPKEDLFRDGLMSPNCVDAAVLTQVINDDTIKSNRMYERGKNIPFRDKMVEIYHEGQD
jgi:hypothetical protein